MTVAAAGRSVAFALQGAAGTAVLAGSVARYAGAFPGVDAAVVAANTAVAEDLTLGSAAAPARYRFALQTQGVTARPAADGGVAFLDAAGQVAFAFAAPRMFDAAHQVSRAVTLTLGQSSAGPTLPLAADPAWLASPQRRYPVTIDPILTVGGGASTDCAIDSAYPASNFCSLAYLAAGASGSEVGRTLLQFGVAPAADVTILSAQVSLYQLAAANSTPGALELHQVTRPWTSGLTWNTSDGSAAWTSPGGDFQPTPAATTTDPGTAANGTWLTFAPTPLVAGWADGSLPSDGFLLKAGDEGAQQSFDFCPSGGRGGSNRPRYTDRTGSQYGRG